MQVERLTLSNPVFDMEGDNTAYLLVEGGTVGLVDVGVATDRTRADLEAGLERHGHSLSAVDHVFLTHWHPDHAGLAGQVQAASGATVHVHEADGSLVAGDDGAVAGLSADREQSFAEWGIPESVREEIDSRRGDDRGPRGFGGERPTVTTFGDGATLALGDATLETLHAPGHTAGETCYLLEYDGRHEVFTGDALLPDYTPNVGGADPRTERPLTDHLRTLRTLARATFERGLPGHGDPMPVPAERARAVLEHHRDRAATLLTVLDGPTTVWEATGALFGDLTETHLVLGLGETHAHLEYLRGVGAVERTDDGYVAADPDLAAAFPEVAR
jgi:glyoxylase-like metal-dependent hydrolase (beta-lactamase superfamily II)